jgi:hypothetical protein
LPAADRQSVIPPLKPRLLRSQTESLVHRAVDNRKLHRVNIHMIGDGIRRVLLVDDLNSVSSRSGQQQEDEECQAFAHGVISFSPTKNPMASANIAETSGTIFTRGISLAFVI